MTPRTPMLKSLLRILAVMLPALLVPAGAGAESVVLKGPVDGTMLHAIAMSGSEIETLDLSQAHIVECREARLPANRTTHGADLLPAYILSGLRARTVVLPAGITAIEEGALMGSDITEITIPASVTRIGDGAFAACTRLRKIVLPATVTETGTHLFAGCTALTAAEIRTKGLPASTFAGCTALSSVTIAEGLDSIGADCFAGCTSLAGIALPQSLKRIGDRAFARSGLTALELADHARLATLGSETFAHCASLTLVTLPAGARPGQGVLFDTPALTYVSLPSALKTLPVLALKGATALTDASTLLPASLDTIAPLALAGMTRANNVVLPSTLRHIDTEAFEGWTGLVRLDAKELRAVPTLGDDVWAGINPAKVFLDTEHDMTALFMAAPQWRDFSFDPTTGLPMVADGTATTDLRVKFEGKLLHISASPAIAHATLHTLGGLAVASQSGEGSTEMTLDTSHRGDSFFILTVMLEDGRTATIKLYRQ